MKYAITDAVRIATALEPEMSAIGMHVAIGGSVVYRGGSDKDIDVFFYPHSKKVAIDRSQIVSLLSANGFKSRKPDDESTQVPDVHVTDEVATGNKVDFFFLERHTVEAAK